MILDKEQIKQRLPHRAPFLFVDGVDAFEQSKSITAHLDIAVDMPFFAGHFPEKPVMPGVLMTEALAQTAGLVISLSNEASGIFYLASCNVKFLEVVEPGGRLQLFARLEKSFNGLFQFSVEARFCNKTAARGNIVLAKKG